MTLHSIAAGLPEDGVHILLAEDDDAAARVVRTILKLEGYRITLAPDGPSVLRHLEEHGPPDVLLLDWMLPGVSGLEICHYARQKWSALELPILMVTAKTDPESVYAAFDAGASDYLAKPFRGAEIRARIAAHLRTKRLVDERHRLEEHLREREKLSALGLVASGVAHDLNNPLAVISGRAQLMLRDANGPAAEDHLREILGAVDRCRRIVGDLLGFVRRQPADRTQVDVTEVVRGTLALRESDLRLAGVRVTLNAAAHLPHVAADPHQLQQVFLNIVINAQQALRDAGSALDVAVGVEEGVVVAGFRNDGPPISAEALPRIFDPFFTTKSAAEGTGLGLAVARRIVEEHGGEMRVESGPRGTTFQVRLRVA